MLIHLILEQSQNKQLELKHITLIMMFYVKEMMFTLLNYIFLKMWNQLKKDELKILNTSEQFSCSSVKDEEVFVWLFAWFKKKLNKLKEITETITMTDMMNSVLLFFIHFNFFKSRKKKNMYESEHCIWK